ncbi:MAG: HNH endonuclease family protein, partial [Actinomycetota bacterium]|nr:HNH endonuclease family protein [Actinomycetota bacterium]
GSMAGYSRERFPHWSDAEEFGWDVQDTSCDVRDAALIRDGKNVHVGEGCDVTSGEWLDPYTGRTYTDPAEIDIDHVVPLANAWRSGASSWGEARREQYANDQQVLLSAEDNANQEKGDKGPEAWK